MLSETERMLNLNRKLNMINEEEDFQEKFEDEDVDGESNEDSSEESDDEEEVNESDYGSEAIHKTKNFKQYATGKMVGRKKSTGEKAVKRGQSISYNHSKKSGK